MLSRDEPRAMPHNRELPVINRTIESRWERKSYAMHMRRLQNIKPSVDNKPPMLPSHMRNNRKREQQQHERLHERRRCRRNGSATAEHADPRAGRQQQRTGWRVECAEHVERAEEWSLRW